MYFQCISVMCIVYVHFGTKKEMVSKNTKMRLLIQPVAFLFMSTGAIGVDANGPCHEKTFFCHIQTTKEQSDQDLFVCCLDRIVSMSSELHHDKNNKVMCAQGRLRSAWASAQSDQSLCCALNR